MLAIEVGAASQLATVLYVLSHPFPDMDAPTIRHQAGGYMAGRIGKGNLMTKYSELLRDPRWQKKRLEIMSRDHWACRFCSDADHILNVHHLYYERYYRPWEYPREALITLCEACHELIHNHSCPLLDLKSYLMERHGYGTLTDEAVTFFFDKYSELAAL